MSKIKDVKLNCPECGAEGEFTLWESVNKQLSPESAEKVKSGEIFKWTCPKCGKTFTVPYSMLYHDMDKSLMIYLLTSRLDLSDGRLTRNGLFQKDYTYRSVFEIDDLREKISIFENGLDDRTVELVKYVFTHQQRPKDIPEDTILRYVGKIEGEGMMLQCVHESLTDHPTMIVPLDMYDSMMADGLHEQVFNQNEDFPEVTQDYLCGIMKG